MTIDGLTAFLLAVLVVVTQIICAYGGIAIGRREERKKAAALPTPETKGTPTEGPLIFGRHHFTQYRPSTYSEGRPWYVYRLSLEHHADAFDCESRLSALILMERLDAIEDAKAGAL